MIKSEIDLVHKWVIHWGYVLMFVLASSLVLHITGIVLPWDFMFSIYMVLGIGFSLKVCLILRRMNNEILALKADKESSD